MKKLTTLLFLLCVIGISEISYGWGRDRIGPDADHPTVSQPQWPKGIVEIPRHTSRVYSRWVNGNEKFYFKTDIDQTNELIALFSKAAMRDYLLIITDKKENVNSFKGEQIDYNVKLNIISGIALGMRRSGNKAETFEPTLTIYTEADSELLRQLKLHSNLIVQCDIQDSPIKSKQVKPERKLWHGKLQLKDGDWQQMLGSGIITKITLWQKGIDDGIKITNAFNGSFAIAFSEEEIAALNQGKNWLTITVGNWLTEAANNDLKIDPTMLNTDITKAKPIIIGQPELYHGRILFKDGLAPKLESVTSSRSKIMINFPYAGIARIDHQGYFQVFFTDEQYETLKSKKSRRNIYIPSYTKKNQSSAKFIFPVSLLSKDKSSAGVVKIPRPETFEK